MKGSFGTLLAGFILASSAHSAQPAPVPPEAQVDGEASPSETTDPTQSHRWHMPRRGARKLPQDSPGPVHAEWNRLGQLANGGKEKLASCGILTDFDLAFFDQYVSHVISGQKNFGTLAWQTIGDWNLFDFGAREDLSALGRGYLSWSAFGTVGLNYDPARESPTGNVGAVDTLNGTVYDEGAVLDELYWKQVALGGKLLVLAGKIDLLNYFDTNRVANDPFSEFFSDSLQNDPSIPAPLYGGFGGVVRGNLPGDAYVMAGMGDASMNAAKLPWETLDNDSWYQLLELGVSPDIPKLGKGTYRLTPWHSHFFGADGFGISLDFDQELGRQDVVAFFRFGSGDADVTQVKRFVSGGLALEAPFRREDDLVAIGVSWSDPGAGGGFRAETLLELFYRVEIAKSMSLTPDLQLVFDPADNPDDDFVVVPGIRLLLTF